MDGVRAYWDGEMFLSRQGKEIQVPTYFSEGLHTTALDGELWMGRDTYEKILEVFRASDADWSGVGYYVFDVPSIEGPYEFRMQHLRELPLPPHVHPVESQLCRDIKHLEEYLEMVLTQGGEGLMARHPQALYTIGRGHTLLKVKVIRNVQNSDTFKRFADAELKVIEIVPTGCICQQ